MDPCLEEELAGELIGAGEEGCASPLMPRLDVALNSLCMLSRWTKRSCNARERHFKRQLQGAEGRFGIEDEG